MLLSDVCLMSVCHVHWA